MACLGARAQEAPHLKAVKAAQLVDPRKGTVLLNPVVLVSGDLVKAAGTDLPIPAGAEVMEGPNADHRGR